MCKENKCIIVSLYRVNGVHEKVKLVISFVRSGKS